MMLPTWDLGEWESKNQGIGIAKKLSLQSFSGMSFVSFFGQSLILVLVQMLFVINVFVFHVEKKNAFKHCVCVLNRCHYQTHCQ